MQGPTGSQTKSCTFKRLRGERVAGGEHAATLKRIAPYCIQKSYAFGTAIALARRSWLSSRWDPFNAHIRAKHFRDHNRTVGLLVILHHGNPGTPHGKS
jgi:hypothetical protein